MIRRAIRHGAVRRAPRDRRLPGAGGRGIRIEPKTDAEHLQLVRYQERARRNMLGDKTASACAAKFDNVSTAYWHMPDFSEVREAFARLGRVVTTVAEAARRLGVASRHLSAGELVTTSDVAFARSDRRGTVWGRAGRRPAPGGRPRHGTLAWRDRRGVVYGRTMRSDMICLRRGGHVTDQDLANGIRPLARRR